MKMNCNCRPSINVSPLSLCKSNRVERCEVTLAFSYRVSTHQAINRSSICCFTKNFWAQGEHQKRKKIYEHLSQCHANRLNNVFIPCNFLLWSHSRSIRKKWSLIRLFAYKKSSCKQRKYNNGGWSHDLLAKGVKGFSHSYGWYRSRRMFGNASRNANFLVTFTFVKIFLQLTRSIKD